GAWYYLRVVAAVVFGPRQRPAATGADDVPAMVGATLCAAATVVLFFAPFFATWMLPPAV
ncbi:MAG: hypothetical protein ACRDD1_03480, partial [Planctomycetia bacterium]